ncbi:unnamed protein product [Linum trigynum]|uniref:Uncharacterized protein n=1 Tax=Linum trigynum TaxID=586398 RepID=A0AAV2DE44_9ROSI
MDPSSSNQTTVLVASSYRAPTISLRGRRNTMDDYLSNDDGRDGVGVEHTCLFGFDLNIPYTSNDKARYEVGAEETENGDDVCMVDDAVFFDIVLGFGQGKKSQDSNPTKVAIPNIPISTYCKQASSQNLKYV